MPAADARAVAQDLLGFVDASPTPFHAVQQAGDRLAAAGFTGLGHADRWQDLPDRGFVARDGALVAWAIPAAAPVGAPFRIVGAHTDSPNLRVRPQPDTGRVGWRQLGVEVYGGALVNSWLDRDLGLAGRVFVSGPDGPVPRLLRVDRPILRVPQLAIHLDREIDAHGLQLNRQQHLTPVWGLGSPDPRGFRRFLGEQLGVPGGDVWSWDLMAFDLVHGTFLGVDDELLASARLDNLCSCFAGIEALSARGPDAGGDTIAVVSLFDHEEVGSRSSSGADGEFLAAILERLALARGADRAGFLAALAGSMCVSADMAHAVHPNYPEKHEPDHLVLPNLGPVVKINTNQRYATDGATQASFEAACDGAAVPIQRFVGRNDMPCGSTIGPATAARLGVPTVDVGIAQLSMHSIRELCGADDPALFVRALTAWLG
jgi:aspartyl aminopeptidase